MHSYHSLSFQQLRAKCFAVCQFLCYISSRAQNRIQPLPLLCCCLGLIKLVRFRHSLLQGSWLCKWLSWEGIENHSATADGTSEMQLLSLQS